MKMATRTVTQADIARALGISQTTVGLVVGQSTSQRGKEKLKPETIERIEQKAKEMGYRPDRHAQIMRNGKTTLIGMIYAGGVMQVAIERALCITQALKERGYGMVPFDVQWHDGSLFDAFENMLDAKVAGILLSVSYLKPEELRRIKEREVPIVGLSSADVEGMSMVRCDMRDGIRKVTDHLLAQGHRRIVQLSHSYEPERPHTQWRWQQALQADGFRDSLLAAGGSHQISPIDDYPQWTQEVAGGSSPAGITLCIRPESRFAVSRWNPYLHGLNFAQEILNCRSPLPDAVVCPNDDWAVGLASGMMRGGIEIPKQLAITGFNASTLAEAFCVPLTTVQQSTKKMSELAVTLLIDEIEKGKPEHFRIHDLPGELIVRDSSLRVNACSSPASLS